MLMLCKFIQLMEKNSVNPSNQISFLQDTLKTVKTQGFQTIDHLLRDSFTSQTTKELKQTGVQQSTLQYLSGFLKNETLDEEEKKIDISAFNTLFNTLLYGSTDYKHVIKQLASGFKGMGVCAKPLKAGDVAWKCEDCEKDKSCIICQDCFNKGDHKGHRVWLKTNVGGCCDCGDPDGWDEKGFCSDHKGFEASSEAMLKSLPAYVKDAAPHCFAQLSNQLKATLLKLENDNSDRHSKVLASEIFNLMIQSCADIPSNIYYLSRALPLIFYGDHVKPLKHTCNYRYFISPADKQTFVESNQHFAEQKAELCSCSTLDLILQTNHLFIKKVQKSVSELFIKLFQTFEFKLHLSLAYTANYTKISEWQNNQQGTMIHLGVQILTIESITEVIMGDPNLRNNFISTLRSMIAEVIDDPEIQLNNFRLLTCLHDLKYMAKVDVLPMIIGKTDFLEQLILSLLAFHFCDCSERPTQMEELESATIKKIQLVQLELEVTSKIQIYLEQVKEVNDVVRILNFFEKVMVDLAEQLKDLPLQSFFLMPIVRMFSFFVQRLQLREIVEGINYQISEKLKTSIIPLIATQNGFIAELKAKLWIYKGEMFQRLSSVYTGAFKEYFLSDIGLLQCLICKHPDSLDKYLEKFGTNPLLAPLFISVSNVSLTETDLETPSEVFNKLMTPWLKNIDAEKLGLLVQNTLNRVVQLCIFEGGVSANYKNLFANDSEAFSSFNDIFRKQVTREVFHVLFMLGTSTTIDKIKKQSKQIFQENSESFMNALMTLTTSAADNQGKITFRLKEEFLSMFDPYYYVDEKQQNLQNAAYQYHRANPKLNSVVGDYQQNYKYSTGVNKQVWLALSRSDFTNVILVVVREYLLESESVKQKIINQQSFNAALKLLVIVVQNLEEGDTKLELFRSQLPKELLRGFVKGTSHEEVKLKLILDYVSSKLFSSLEDTEMVSVEASLLSQPSLNRTSSEMMQKKKQEMIAKMKAKQQNFLKKVSSENKSDNLMKEESKDDGQKNSNEMTCASCQEPLNLQSYQERMYVQLGYVSRSKLLYRSYVQTSRQQVKPFTTFKGEFKTDYACEKTEISLKELINEEANELAEFGLNDVLDVDTKCGSHLNRCCHYFHADCLAQYRTAEANKNYQQAYVRSLIGFDDDMIQCPICKTLSNTFQPVLPATKDTSKLEVHIQFISDLLTKPQDKPRDILYIDIKNNPEDFLQKLMQFTAHTILTVTTYRQSSMLRMHDPQLTSTDITLRDLVYILRSGFEVVRRSQQETKDFTLHQLGESLLVTISDNNFTENPFKRNHSKLVVQLLFCISLLDNNENIQNACLESVYSVFKAQIAASYLFQKESGVAAHKNVYEEWPTRIKTLFQTETDQQQQDQFVEMQLQFLRTAACMKLVTSAINEQESQEQLGIQINVINDLKSLPDNLSEFKYLIDFLKLQGDEVYQEPESLKLLEDSSNNTENIYFAVQQATSLNSDIVTQLILLGQQQRTTEQDKLQSDPFLKPNQCESVVIPKIMTVLTPFFTLQLLNLPNDYQTLVKEFYIKQCRNCRKQLQTNAICLLCGEIVCLLPNDPCCMQLPGMLRDNTLNLGLMMQSRQDKEGELSYHARYWEGGSTAFLVPSSAEVFLVDNGRISNFDSFYRNRLGEVFSAETTKKWDNFYTSEETGGLKILVILRRLIIQGELPNFVIQERQKSSKVFRRNAY